MIDFSAVLPTFVITLREGFEAALVVGIVLACLQKAQQFSFYQTVYQGIFGGLIASILVGIGLASLLQGVNTYDSLYTPIIKELLASLFGAIAVGMLSWMLIWMTQQAKQVKFDVESHINTVLGDEKAGKRGIFLLVFIAVLREGFESVLFILAKFQDNFSSPILGAIAGLLTATILGLLLFKMGIKINIRLFFKVMGVFLLLIVGGLVIGVFKHADTAMLLLFQFPDSFINCPNKGLTCFLGSKFWDFSESLPDQQFPGILLKSLFGYRQVIYWGQAMAYFLFMMIVGGFYFQSLSGNASQEKSPKLRTDA